MDNKITLADLEESLYLCAEDIQKSIAASAVDSDIKLLLDHIAQQQHYVLASIIDYLKQ